MRSRRLIRWSDTSDAGRRLRRALIANSLTSPLIRALDRRRSRRLGRESDHLDRSKSRWREAHPDHGLTWGEDPTGEAAARAADAHGAFGSGATVLEIGPGYGRVLRSCLELGVEFDRYVGLDLSERNVAHLTKEFGDPRVEFRQGDADAAELGIGVDSLISFLVFKHLYPSFEPALANLGPQMNPGAVAVFDLLEGSRSYFHRDGATFIRHYTRDEVAEILDRVGMPLVELGSVEHSPGRERLLVVARGPRA